MTTLLLNTLHVLHVLTYFTFFTVCVKREVFFGTVKREEREDVK